MVVKSALATTEVSGDNGLCVWEVVSVRQAQRRVKDVKRGGVEHAYVTQNVSGVSTRVVYNVKMELWRRAIRDHQKMRAWVLVLRDLAPVVVVSGQVVRVMFYRVMRCVQTRLIMTAMGLRMLMIRCVLLVLAMHVVQEIVGALMSASWGLLMEDTAAEVTALAVRQIVSVVRSQGESIA